MHVTALKPRNPSFPSLSVAGLRHEDDAAWLVEGSELLTRTSYRELLTRTS